MTPRNFDIPLLQDYRFKNILVIFRIKLKSSCEWHPVIIFTSSKDSNICKKNVLVLLGVYIMKIYDCFYYFFQRPPRSQWYDYSTTSYYLFH